MLQAVINRAQRSVDTLVNKYVTRIAVSVPFVVALGFGTAAAAVKLSQEFGNTTAYAILAATFAVIGLAASAIIAMSGSNPETGAISGDNPAAGTTSATGDTDASNAKSSIDPEFILAALGTVGPMALPSVVRLLARNLPLVLAIVAIAYVLFSERSESDGAPEIAL